MPTGAVAEKIYKELFDHLTAKGNAFDRAHVGTELFTPTERIMLAKRLAIICMLGEGYTFDDIQETLRVSPSTIGRIWEAMQKGKYTKIISIVRKRKVMDIITMILPRPRHMSRWDYIERKKKRGL
jgi:uncharacterized protein YerC